jgi:hypothetical protein
VSPGVSLWYTAWSMLVKGRRLPRTDRSGSSPSYAAGREAWPVSAAGGALHAALAFLEEPGGR